MIMKKLLFTLFCFSAIGAFAQTDPIAKAPFDDMERHLYGDTLFMGYKHHYNSTYGLYFEISSSDEAVATTDLISDEITIVPQGLGTATITIMSQDTTGVGAGGSPGTPAYSTFEFTVLQPKVVYSESIELTDHPTFTFEGTYHFSGHTNSFLISPDGTKIIHPNASLTGLQTVMNRPNDVLNGFTGLEGDVTSFSESDYALRAFGNPNLDASSGIAFHPNGLSATISASKGGKKFFFQLSFSSPFDLRTMIDKEIVYHSDSTGISAYPFSTGYTFYKTRYSNDGLKLFTFAQDDAASEFIKVQQFDLTVPFDISAGLTEGASFDVTGFDQPYNYFFNKDGSQLYIEMEPQITTAYALEQPFELGGTPDSLGTFSMTPLIEALQQTPGSEFYILMMEFSHDMKTLFVSTWEDGLYYIGQFSTDLLSPLFKEVETNDGSVEGSMLITAYGNRFVDGAGTLTEGTHFTIDGVPAGLTSVITVEPGGFQATLTFDGQAIDHSTTNDVADLTITFTDAAFQSGSAAEVSNAVAASTGFGIEFMDCTPPTSFFEIQDITRVSGSDSTTYGLNFIFENPGVHSLNVTASSTDEAVATVSVQKSGLDENVGYDLNVNYNGPGTSDITVTVATVCGESISQTFSVAVVQPELTFTPAVSLLDDLTLTYEGSSQIMGMEHAYFSPDGTKIFRTGSTSMAYELELNVPNDITSGATTSPELFKGSSTEFKFRPNTTAYYASSRGITFSKDGKKIFGQTAASTNIFIQASLETPFDLRSEHTVDSEFVPAIDGHLQNMHFSEDGLSLFYYDFTLLKVQELKLTAPFDVSGGFTDGASFGVDSLTTTWSYDFNRDGTVVQLVDAEKFKISYYSLNAPFDLSEAPVYLGEYVLDSTGLGSPGYSGKTLDNIYWSKDQKKLYVETYEYEAGKLTVDMLHQYGVSGGATAFKETESNSGRVEGELLITTNGSTFMNAGGKLTKGTHFTIDNLPAGLVPVATVSADGYQLALTFTGAALDHDVIDNIGDLNITFTNAAFESGNASAFANAVAASTGFGIEFTASPKPEIVGNFSDTTVYTISGALEFNLQNYFSSGETLTYTVSSSDNAVVSANVVSETLSVNVLSAGSAEVAVTAKGETNGTESQTFVVTGLSPYLVFGEDDGTGTLTGGFTETEANDGTVQGSIVAAIYGSSFTNAGSTLDNGVHFTVDNLPAGFSAAMSVNAAGDIATLTLTGQADSHDDVDDVADLQITFMDAAFELGQASDFTNAIAASTGFGVTFIANPVPEIIQELSDTTVYLTAALEYNLAEYFSSAEALAYTASSADNAIATATVATEVLSVNMVSAGSTEVTVTATGKSGKAIFQSFTITIISPYLVFGEDDGTGTLTGGFTETGDDSGAVEGSIVATVYGNQFSNAGGTLEREIHFTVDNLPAGFSATMTVNATGDQAILTLTGQAASHDIADDVNDLQVTFTDAAFELGQTSGFTNAIAASTGFGISFMEAVAPVGVIANVTLVFSGAGTSGMTLSLEGVFTDAATLTYTVISSNERVATVEIVGTDIIITPVGPGITTITVIATRTSAGGRTQSESIEFDVEVTNTVAATNDQEGSRNVLIYPNPTTKEFTIDLGREYTNISVEITNASGKVISTEFYDAIRQLQSSIDAEAGVYILSIMGDQLPRSYFRIVKH